MQIMNNRLDRPVDSARDHIVGDPSSAAITLVEYGSYDCPHCRAANGRITEVRNQLGERVRYVFRHRPITDSDLARRAADLVEQAANARRFLERACHAHDALDARSPKTICTPLPKTCGSPSSSRYVRRAADEAKARVDADIASSHASGVRFTPTFFINGLRYDGPWDEASFTDAMLGLVRASRAHRRAGVRELGAVDRFMLLLATVLAIVLTNSAAGERSRRCGRPRLAWRSATADFSMSLLQWVNDALLTVFFLVVGLEIKREFTVGHLATRRSAALPIAAAIGGMVVPALIYVSLVPAGSVADRLGRAHGHRHRVRGGADRDDGRARAGGAAHLSNGRGDR